MARLFVAIKIDESLKEKILDVERRLAGFGQIKFVEKDNFHLTLKFLGEQPDNNVNNISKRIEKLVEKFTKFKISLEGLSFFTPKIIRVIFVGVGDGKENIVKMEKDLNEKLKEFREEDFDPHPHLTIGRVGSVGDKKKLLERIKELENVFIGEMEVEEIFLMESKLKGSGPVYSEIEKFEFITK